MPRVLLTSQIPRRMASRASNHVRRRVFSTSLTAQSAHEFAMPAMSPTMTEGNIANWKINEGDAFSAGDVLLEIETDKAQMEVEAQDDGIMAKIVEQAGAKGVKVGTKIAITADPDDDLASLDFSTLQSSSSDISARRAEEPEGQEEQKVTQDSERLKGGGSKAPSTRSTEKSQYPLFPSVVQLLNLHGIQESEVEEMASTGPNGRLLKGDVLAYLGKINASYPGTQSKRIQQLGQLDLSKIELKEPDPTPAPSKPQPSLTEESSKPVFSEVALPVSFAEVRKVRKRVREALGVDVGVNAFLVRASQLCNDGLPESRTRPQTSNDLFESLLGLEKTLPRARLLPLVPELRVWEHSAKSLPHHQSGKIDVIDELLASPSQYKRRVVSNDREPDTGVNILSVRVPKGDEVRAKIFLERMKTCLQVEPGRLVL